MNLNDLIKVMQIPGDIPLCTALGFLKNEDCMKSVQGDLRITWIDCGTELDEDMPWEEALALVHGGQAVVRIGVDEMDMTRSFA